MYCLAQEMNHARQQLNFSAKVINNLTGKQYCQKQPLASEFKSN